MELLSGLLIRVFPQADLALNFQKRRGQGNLSVRRPRGSGIQGESLEIAARWSGDVVKLLYTLSTVQVVRFCQVLICKKCLYTFASDCFW